MASPQPQPHLTLDRGGLDDLAEVMGVMNAAFGARYGEGWTRSQCAGILPMRGIDLVLAHSDDRHTIGFSLSRTVADESELLLIAVVPAWHRRGAGRALLDEFLERARNAGLDRVHLEVRDGNPAIDLYRKAGFVPVGRRRNYYKCADGSRLDAITFVREL